MKLTQTEMCSFLMYREIDPVHDQTVNTLYPNRIPVSTAAELETYLKNRLLHLDWNKTALALSGGIDSAILARFMPKGAVAYTFKCIVPGVDTLDETLAASKIAEECGLEHRIVEVYWEDVENSIQQLMYSKRAPIHSIEVQIYKACLQAKQDGFDALVFGEAADAVYGGLDGLLSKDWPVGEFIERYSYVLPYWVLKEPQIPIEIFKKWENRGYIDPHLFVSNVFIHESVGSYLNSSKTASMKLILPYPETYLACPINYEKIRSGENKYIVRDVFRHLYPSHSIPRKTPMPRPVGEWLKEWKGPVRDEFWKDCAINLTGDQKWLVWILEKYLDMQNKV